MKSISFKDFMIVWCLALFLAFCLGYTAASADELNIDDEIKQYRVESKKNLEELRKVFAELRRVLDELNECTKEMQELAKATRKIADDDCWTDGSLSITSQPVIRCQD